MMQISHGKLNQRWPWVKTSLNKRNLFTRKFDLNLRKKLEKGCIWSIGFYGAVTWTLRKVDQKYEQYSFERWFWRRLETINWTDHARNEEELQRFQEESKVLQTIKRRKDS
jgi:hypothetical protein